ncbi:MAG: hypothetical protein K8S98_00630, partial [Planctomycetes bacterium]|nr:hypothetical protein [Planctomycetota bacterium]
MRALAAELALAETTKPSPTVRVSEGASPRRVEASPPIRKYSAATFELVARISRGTESSDERRLVTRSDDRVHIVEHGG